MINNQKAKKQARSKHKQDVELFNIALVEAIQSLPPPVDWSELPRSEEVFEDYMARLFDKVTDLIGCKEDEFKCFWIEAAFKIAIHVMIQDARERKYSERASDNWRPSGRLLAFSKK